MRIRRRRLAMLPHRLRRPGVVLTQKQAAADDVRPEDPNEAVWGAHPSGTPAPVPRRPSRSVWSRKAPDRIAAYYRTWVDCPLPVFATFCWGLDQCLLWGGLPPFLGDCW